MKLHKLKIIGYRRLKEIELYFGDATFIIGQNNCGKSSALKAIEVLLSAKKTLPSTDYYSIIDEETGETKPDITKITLEAEFRNLPEESKSWRGFKGRIFSYEAIDENDSGLSVVYRKTFELGKDVVIEFKAKEKTINPLYEKCKTANDYINQGLDSKLISEHFSELDKNIGTSKSALEKLDSIDEIWDLSETESWFENPGGIPGNVLKMLPRYLLIPADSSISELQGNGGGVLGKTLSELFETVREGSDNFKNAQEYLTKLSRELDPKDEDSEFGKMMTELNSVLSSVFPDSKLHATTDLSDPSKVLKPAFNVEMSSNVRTSIENQGTGMIRAAVFGMLRFRQKWLSKREDDHNRSLIICFEEPEIYLHPSAANQMRDAIYDLSKGDSQILATTHSPYLIDISRKPRQILNRFKADSNHIVCDCFNVSDQFKSLQADDKSYVKMLLKIDPYIARAFFTQKVIIIEGDTEDILLKESLTRLPKASYLSIVSNFEIIKARGKASIIGLAKYLTSMGINPIVIHDKDSNTPDSFKYNASIASAVGNNGRIILMEESVEEQIGYTATYEKPFKAFKEAQSWGQAWTDLPEGWRNKLKEVFEEYIP
ncbi:AAA family ATPase [Fluviicola sp.]|uniref:AAA family ATPase n=1 Tax=Fluviicola sp. TaxID=1917219 RepID=UPI0026212D08|nr:AAA family ATPase [Fluviicola sp.]